MLRRSASTRPNRSNCSRREFHLGFFQRELDLYLEACRTAGTLATALNPEDEAIKRAIDRFYALYWGDLSVVEDPLVEQAMIDFEVALRDWQSKGGMATQEMRSRSYKFGASLPRIHGKNVRS